MPRHHKKPVQIEAASPAMVAAMLCIRPDDLMRAIHAGDIKVYQIGIRRRILLEDARAWVRTKWLEAVYPRKRKSKTEVSHDNAS